MALRRRWGWLVLERASERVSKLCRQFEEIQKGGRGVF